MSNIIDSIQLSGVTYQIQGSGGGGVPESTFTAYTATTDERISQDEEVTAAALNELNDAVNGKQDTLSAGTNITIVDNVISAEGGGKAIEAGRGIAITTGETADTVSFSLPISAGTGTNSIAEGEYTTANGEASHAEGSGTIASGFSSHAEGQTTEARGRNSHTEGYGTIAIGQASHAEGNNANAKGDYSHAEGIQTQAKGNYSHAEGGFTKTTNPSEHASGQYNVSSSASTTFGDSGNTLFSVGNGTAGNARHNAFEIRQNGDIYLTKDGQDVKLQDQLGGGGSSYTAGDGIDITNDVISVTGKADTSAVTEVSDALTAHTANTTVHTTAAEKSSWNGAATNASNALMALGGLSLIKLTQAEYDALATKDNNTLYVIVN